MTSLDLSKLSAPDAAIAFRSYPRRYRQTVLPVANDPEIEELAYRIGPSGMSALDLVVNTTNTWALLRQALHQVLVDDNPVLHPSVRDAAAREWTTEPADTVDDALGRLADEADGFAVAVEHVHSPDWNRPGVVAGDATMTALDLVREAVRVGSENLHAADVALKAVRRT